MTDYPNILRVAQCSAPEIPTFGETFFHLFESKVTSIIGITAFLDSPARELIDPEWVEYEIASKASWKQACFQVAESIDSVPGMGLTGQNRGCFIGAIIIELLQEWMILAQEDPFLDNFAAWLSEAHRIRCGDCGSEKLDRSEPTWIFCETCQWQDQITSLESTISQTKPSNYMQQYALKAFCGADCADLTDIPLLISLGDAFLDTCIELGLGKALHRSLINRRQ